MTWLVKKGSDVSEITQISVTDNSHAILDNALQALVKKQDDIIITADAKSKYDLEIHESSIC